VPLKKLNGVEE